MSSLRRIEHQLRSAMEARRVGALAWRLGVMLALGLTFAAYLRPDMVLDVATRVWSCFGA